MMIDVENSVLKIGATLLTAAAVCRFVLSEWKHIVKTWYRLRALAASMHMAAVAPARDSRQGQGLESVRLGYTSHSTTRTMAVVAVRVHSRLMRGRTGSFAREDPRGHGTGPANQRA